MGLFDWLKGPKTTAQTQDLIWLTRQAKFAALKQGVAQALADPNGPDAIFVVAHFQDCLAELQSLAKDAGWDESRVFVTLSNSLESGTGSPASVRASMMWRAMSSSTTPALEVSVGLGV